MTDVQLYMAIGVPMLFNALLITVFTNAINKRIEDMRDLWRAELSSAKSELREEFRVGQANVETRFAELRALIERNHSETLSRFGDIDARLNRLENERRILQ